jgi:hypothetical protein
MYDFKQGRIAGSFSSAIGESMMWSLLVSVLSERDESPEEEDGAFT